MVTSPSMVWAHPDARLWVAVGSTTEGQAHAGIVERIGEVFAAIDGIGGRLGTFPTRSEAEDAVRGAWGRGTAKARHPVPVRRVEPGPLGLRRTILEGTGGWPRRGDHGEAEHVATRSGA